MLRTHLSLGREQTKNVNMRTSGEGEGLKTSVGLRIYFIKDL